MSNNRIGVVDYGIGNLGSLGFAIQAAGGEPVLSSDPDELRSFDRLILPGVGSMSYCWDRLAGLGFCEPLHEYRRSGRPLLGICVGMQLFMEEGCEFSRTPGLGFLAGSVKAMETELPVPHIGYNALEMAAAGHRSWFAPAQSARFYFLHSFHCEPANPSVISATVAYGARSYAACVAKDNLYGVQFHPEVSGRPGIAFFQQFLQAA